MYALFLKVFNMSIAASWLILAVLLLRTVLHKAPKTWRCVLWALVGVRLVMPFSLESVFSLIPSTEVIAPEAMYATEPTLNTGISSVDKVVNPVFTATFRAADTVTSVNPLQVWTFISGYIWRIGVVMLLLYTLVTYIRLKHRVSDAVLHKENIYQSERVASPFVLGIFRPRIYIPYGLSMAEQRCVLAHERAHIARMDYILKPLAFIILAVHWFNPLVWVAYVLLCRDMEYACDEKVINEMGAKGKKEYAETLLSRSMPRHRLSMCPLAFGETGVKSRIRNVVNYKKPGFWLVLVAVALIFVIVVGFLTDPVEDAAVISLPDDNPDLVTETGESILEPEESVQAVRSEPVPDPEFVLPEQPYEEGSSMPILYVYSVADPMEMVALQSSTASKTTMQNGQMMGIQMCGIGPLAEEAEHIEIELQGRCEVKIASVVTPDSFTMREYDPADRGNQDAEPLSEVEGKGDESVILEQGRIYEVHVVWDETHLEENGFYRDAYYFLEMLYSSELYAIAPEISEILGDFTYVAKVEVVNGNTGETLEYDCCDGIDTIDQGIINLCKQLHFTLDEALVELLERPLGYQYMINFLNEDGSLVQRIIPYEDSVCIGGVMYRCETLFERGTSMELIKTLKSLF